ncbi:MAG: hypothetical protein ACRC40_01970 [Fusobacteriaceae bacterium]
MYFMIGTGVLALTTMALSKEVWELHKKGITADKAMNRKKQQVVELLVENDGLLNKNKNTELALSRVKVELKKSEEQTLNFQSANRALTKQKMQCYDEIVAVKETVVEAREEIERLKSEKNKLEKSLKLSQDEATRLKGEVAAVRSELGIANVKIDKIRTMNRDYRREYLNNGFKYVNFFNE